MVVQISFLLMLLFSKREKRQNCVSLPVLDWLERDSTEQNVNIFEYFKLNWSITFN